MNCACVPTEMGFSKLCTEHSAFIEKRFREVTKLAFEGIKLVFEGEVVLHKEDGGQALVSDNIESTSDPRTFVRVQSWSDGGMGTSEENRIRDKHPELMALKGKRVRITVQEI